MAALPLFVLPLAHVFSDDKMSSRKSIGVVIGFVGALVLIGPTAFDFSEGRLAFAATGLCCRVFVLRDIERADPSLPTGRQHRHGGADARCWGSLPYSRNVGV